MKKLLQIILLFSWLVCFSQQDTIRKKYEVKRTNIGINYDFFNSIVGFSISNDANLEPLIHFEDFTTNFRYKIEVGTNFNKNWNANSYFGFHFPNKTFIKEIGFQNRYYDYKDDLKLLNFGIVGRKFIDIFQSVLILKLNYQELNHHKNFGVEMGGQTNLVAKKLFTEFGFGLNSSYLSYYIQLQSLFYKDKFGINMGFEKIDDYDFAKVGINYQITHTIHH